VNLTITGANLPTQVGTTGAATLRADGSGQCLIRGHGNDTLTTSGTNQLVFAGRGGDSLATNGAKSVTYGGTGTNTISVNRAQDSIVLQQGGVDHVAGFNLHNDVLDLSQVLAEAQLALTGTGQLGTYFGVTSAGTDATLSFNPNGVSCGAGSALAVLHGVGANVTLSALIDNGVFEIG
jgi:hypothetical protein